MCLRRMSPRSSQFCDRIWHRDFEAHQWRAVARRRRAGLIRRRHFARSFEIAGDGGLIEWSSDSTAPINLLLRKDKADAPDVGLPGSPVAESPYTTQIKEFYEALKADRAARVSAADGLAAVQIALAAIESAQTGKPIQIARLPEVGA